MNVIILIFVTIPKWTFILLWWTMKWSVIGIFWLISVPYIVSRQAAPK